jgi:hypothetical protein
MPIGTNNNPAAVEAIINLPPPAYALGTSAAYATNGQMYIANASDLIISNSSTGINGTGGTNITIWFQDPNAAGGSYLTVISNDFYALKKPFGTSTSTNVISMNKSAGIDAYTNVSYAGYSFVTNVQYYDYRESDTVQAVQIDVSKLNVWLTNTAPTNAATVLGSSYNATSYSHNGHGIRSIYVYNNVQPASGSPGTLPAVRMVNGAQLTSTTDPGGSGRTTSGLTVTTPQPLYVKGNYNVQIAGSAGSSAGTADTTYTYPAALMGDAITVLSSSWSDAYNSGTALSSRAPTSTTINAAALEGIVQSTNVGSSLYYSGGIENFLRLEENWSASYIVTYNGSIVVMFPSIYATSFWQVPGNYYNPPTRHWGFDANVTNPSKLPPLTPKIYRIQRTSWIDY